MGPGAQDRRTARFTPAEVSELLGHRTAARAEMSAELHPAEAKPAMTRPPSSGAPLDSICTRPDRDYPGDTDICFVRSAGEISVRLTPADRPKLFAAAGGLAPKLEELREQAGHLARENVPAMDLAARTAHAAAVRDLVSAAHAAGYRLADEDWREAAQYPPAVADFLRERLEQARLGENPASGEAGPDVRALERVIELLERK